MYPILIKKARESMGIVTFKMSNILEKYEDGEQLNVKDLSDLERYSEILKNLSIYLDSFYGKW